MKTADSDSGIKILNVSMWFLSGCRSTPGVICLEEADKLLLHTVTC